MDAGVGAGAGAGGAPEVGAGAGAGASSGPGGVVPQGAHEGLDRPGGEAEGPPRHRAGIVPKDAVE